MTIVRCISGMLQNNLQRILQQHPEPRPTTKIYVTPSPNKDQKANKK